MKPTWKAKAYKQWQAKESWRDITNTMWIKQSKTLWKQYGYSNKTELMNDLKLYIENWADA